MKKSAAFAAIAIVAVSGIFAQPKNSEKAARPKLPPDVKLPDASIVKEYHDARLNSLKALLDAKVKAGVCTQEWADARMVIIKERQADCKGECILFGRCGGRHHRGGPGFCENPPAPNAPKPHHPDEHNPAPKNEGKGKKNGHHR